MAFHGVLAAVTEEWVEFYEKQKKDPENLKSIFWRLALHFLPEGVDPNDPRVLAALDRIREVNTQPEAK